MSDHAQLAHTGIGGAIVIGGVTVAGYWLLAIPLAIALLGALAVRLMFRRGRTAGQR